MWKRLGRDNLKYMDAYEDVICDALEPMFTDGKLAEKLVEYANTTKEGKGLLKTLLDFFRSLAERIKKAYANLKPDDPAAIEMLKNQKALEKAADLFAKALTGASSNFANADVKAQKNTTNKGDVESDKKNSNAKKGRNKAEKEDTLRKGYEQQRSKVSNLSAERQQYLKDKHAEYGNILEQLDIGDKLISAEGDIIGEVVTKQNGNLTIIGDGIIEVVLNDTFTDDGIISFLDMGGSFDISVKKQIKANAVELNKMEVVASLDLETFPTDKQSITEWILEKLSNINSVVSRVGFGEIIFDEKRVKKGFAYKKTNSESIAVLLVPQVIEKGIEIYNHPNHKERKYNTITFAAPIEINGHRGNMAVVVRQEGENYYKVHRVLTPDDSQFDFYEKRDITETAGRVENELDLSPTDNISKDSIPNPEENVKEISEKHSDKMVDLFNDVKGNDDIKFSHRSSYWYPNMGKTEIAYVELLAKHELTRSDKFIDNENKWLYNERKELPYFALYSTASKDEPTVMYACKGNRAKKEYAWFMNVIEILRSIDNGSYEQSARVLNKVLENFRNDILANNQNGGFALGRRGNDGVFGMAIPKSNFRPSRALLNCLENIGEIQKRGGVERSFIPDVRNSDRDIGLDSRTLLANAIESTELSETEKYWLKKYKAEIASLNADQERLNKINAEIKEICFTKGKDRSKLPTLKNNKKTLEDRILKTDKQLLKFEVSKSLKKVLEKEKEQARKNAIQNAREKIRTQREKSAQVLRDTMNMYNERIKTQREGRNKTELRHKIKKVVKDLNKLLLKGTKEKHVMVGLQKAVAAALEIVNMDTVSADERVAKYDALIAKETNPEIIASLTESRDRIQSQADKLSEKLSALKEAYNEIKNSTDESVNSQYDEIIFSRIESVQKKVGNISLRNMTLEQLQEVYDLYTMVLTSVRNSNKAFAEDIKITRMQLGSNTLDEIKDAHKAREYVGKVQSGIEKFMWQNMKPMTSVKRIRRLFYT